MKNTLEMDQKTARGFKHFLENKSGVPYISDHQMAKIIFAVHQGCKNTNDIALFTGINQKKVYYFIRHNGRTDIYQKGRAISLSNSMRINGDLGATSSFLGWNLETNPVERVADKITDSKDSGEREILKHFLKTDTQKRIKQLKSIEKIAKYVYDYTCHYYNIFRFVEEMRKIKKQRELFRTNSLIFIDSISKDYNNMVLHAGYLEEAINQYNINVKRYRQLGNSLCKSKRVVSQSRRALRKIRRLLIYKQLLSEFKNFKKEEANNA